MRQQLVLLCAQVVSEGFLRQSAISPVDRYCSPERQVHMMRLLIRFIELAQKAVDAGANVEDLSALPVVRGLQRMGEDIPEDQLARFEALHEQLEADFANWTRATANVR